MYSLSRRLHLILLAVLFMVLAACGGGGVASEGGIGGSGISMGVMQDQNTSTNTAKINGVTFDTTNTTYSEEGGSASAANVQPGMVIVVQGTIDPLTLTGTASSIAYADLLEGPITAITATSISAMGQTILVDGATVYSGVTDLASLAPGNVIEVSGFFTASGNIYATYVELTGNSTHEIKGVITAVDPDKSFNIGDLLVNWANTTGLAMGDFVQAEGIMNDATTTLAATSVTPLSQNLAVADADEAEVEGLVTTACLPTMLPLSTPCTFQLGFVTVQVADTTQIDGGLLADIQPGVRIEVEGTLSNNIVVAEKIEFKDSVELVSNVSATGTDTLTLEYGDNDVMVRYDPLVTELNGFPAFGDISVSAHIKVRARKAGNELIATRIEDNTGNTELELQGPVDAANLPLITILGVTLDTDAFGLTFTFKDQNGVDIPQDQFFALLGTNTLVKVQGDIDITNAINWVSIEIEE